MKTKVCSKCKEEKPLDCFYKRSDYNSYRSECKDCFQLRAAKRWKEDPEFRAKGIERSRRWQRQNLYNLSLVEENKLLDKQNNQCALCGKDFKSNQDYHVDHCHKTNKVRGLLCPSCNKGLGLFYDKPNVLRKAAEYVEGQGFKVPTQAIAS